MANSNNTGLEIVTKGDGTYVGEIELNSTSTTMTLDCSISKDQDIELHGKTNITITNNLCGNDTYVILDSNKNKLFELFSINFLFFFTFFITFFE